MFEKTFLSLADYFVQMDDRADFLDAKRWVGEMRGLAGCKIDQNKFEDLDD